MGDHAKKLKYSHFLWELQGLRIININKHSQKSIHRGFEINAVLDNSNTKETPRQ